MAQANFTPIQLYRSTTASAVPTSGNLADGELAINTNDGKLYYKDSGGTVQLIASKAGASGDVVGPASATDNAVVRFDGTTGKLVQNSVVTIADSTGDVAGVGALTASGNLTLSGGTANGVLYLNGSKVATSGSALTFNGTTFTASGSSNPEIKVKSTAGTTGNYAGILFDSFNSFSGSGQAYVRGVSSNPANSNTDLSFGVNASGFGAPFEAMRLDAVGNLGLGVTPNSGWTDFTVFQNENAAILGYDAGQAHYTLNTYYQSGTWKYIGTSNAARYTQTVGQHQWFTAASGTAGNAISFSQVMTLDASGNLVVGDTSVPFANFRGFFNASVASDIIGVGVRNTDSSGGSRFVLGNNTGAGRCSFGYTGSTSSVYAWGASTGYIGTESTEPFIFITSGTERARITSGGEVYIAGTTDQGAYNLQCNGTGVWGAGAYVNGSDERLKDDIQSLDSCLNVVNALRPVTFKYKPEHSKDQSVQTGFIAQELKQVLAGKSYLEGLVQEGPQHLNVAYQNIIPLLTKAIQEQQALIESLTARVVQLEGA